MATYDIVAMTLKGRANHATQVQQVLTENGCAIRARIGLHEGVQDACSNEGLILLQVCGSGDDIAALLTSLNAIEGVNAKHMALD